jgi:filamentous hemagglutinin family protein
MQSKTLLSLLAVTGAFLQAEMASAQALPPSVRTPQADQTLGTKVSGTNNNFTVTGGLNRGQTLFHSFKDFSIPTGGAANFKNPAGTRDIITRVTGSLFSDINGTLNSNGANFLLINPNGVVFGPNARLNVGKAFAASTASGVDLIDGQGRQITFGTKPGGDAPLLKINPNVFLNISRLNMGAKVPGNAAIINYGTLQNQTNNSGQYIGLIGGDVGLIGGGIIAPGGKVELAGLSQAGGIGFSFKGVQFPANVGRGDVVLVTKGTSPSFIDVQSAGGGGSVDIFAKDITLRGTGTNITTGISAGSVSPNATAGDIKVDATGKIELSEADIFNQVAVGGVGKAGNIEINTRNLSLINGAQIQASTKGKGDAGNVKITATDKISFDGINNKDGFRTAAFSSVAKGGEGKGGNIEINTRNLSLTNSAQIQASTLGKGDAGNVKITASGDISFDGFGSSAFSTVEKGAVGKGGNIEINTRNLSFTNGAESNASTKGKGDAGNIKITASGDISFDGFKNNDSSGVSSNVEKGAVGKGGNIEINTRNLSLTNIGQIQAATFGKGDAGNIKITATGDISVDGFKDSFSSGIFSVVETGAVGKGGNIEINTRNLSLTNGAQLTADTRGQGDAGNVKITATGDISVDGFKDGFKDSFSSGIFSIVGQRAVGKGGNIEINTRNLSLTNGAQLNSSTLGQGEAGNIFLNANTIKLNNGKISSTSTSSTGGDLNITTQNYLLLRNNSSIATDSDSTTKNGNGGNITIDSPLIVALPGNNDISANAFQGSGGKVNITSQGLFGIKFRPKGQDSLFTNDITASSTFGQSGTVNISTPGTDPGKDSTQLPNVPVDASNQIAQACGASRENKFIVAGRGGLPPNANDPLTSDVVWQDARGTNSQPTASSATTDPTKLAPPATGLVFDGKGKATLIAAGTQGQPTGTSVVCPSVVRK